MIETSLIKELTKNWKKQLKLGSTGNVINLSQHNFSKVTYKLLKENLSLVPAQTKHNQKYLNQDILLNFY